MKKQRHKKKWPTKPTPLKRGRDTPNGFMLAGREVIVERRRMAEPSDYGSSMTPRRTKMS
jgi:hypothetical protein